MKLLQKFDTTFFRHSVLHTIAFHAAKLIQLPVKLQLYGEIEMYIIML